MGKDPEISIILPCLNEEEAIGNCLDTINNIIKKECLDAEVIVVDNGSEDNSCKIAREKGARVVRETERGYGAAYLAGFRAAKGNKIFMADSDGTYDFNEISNFIRELDENDFVIGNRFKGEIEKGAMPLSHKHIGNPILSGVLRLFFKANIRDAHCGMRAVRKEALDKLDLRTTGMEFASEMVVKAGKKNLKIKELPINYHKRKGSSKLRSFPDGWRHLRFMLLYSPLFLFLIPGLVLFFLGLGSMLWLYFGSPEILGIRLQYHPMFLSALLIIVGYQLIIFSLFAKTYSITNLKEKSKIERIYRHITIEKASIIGAIITVLGIIIYITIFVRWLQSGFGALEEIKNSIIALTLIIIGIQTIFSSFMLSILGIKEK